MNPPPAPSCSMPRLAPAVRAVPQSERAVITGIGVVASNGIGVEQWWSAILNGRPGIARVSRFDPSGYPATLAGEVGPFDPAEHLPSRLLPQTDQMTRLGLMAADQAMRDGGIEVSEDNSLSIGVMTSASGGGIEFGQRELENMWARGKQHVSAFQSFAWFYAVNTGQISIRHGLRGPGGVVVSDHAGGLDALGQARRSLRHGSTAMLTGGADGAICPWGWLAQLATGYVSFEDDARRAYRPFAPDACGYVPAEGAAMFVLEAESVARQRGARHTYGSLAGYAATFDGGQQTTGSGLARAATQALADAGLTSDDIDLVFPDAAGVMHLDRAEALALNSVFGARPIPVTMPKVLTGRALAASAALDVAAAMLALRDQLAPPSYLLDPHPSLGLAVGTGGPRPMSLHAVLVLARGYGGFNAAAVLTGV